MVKKSTIIIVIFVLFLGIFYLVVSRDTVFKEHGIESEPAELTVLYPFDNTLFPPEIAAPTFWWSDEHSEADTWLIHIEFEDAVNPVEDQVDTTQWSPPRNVWETIKKRSLEKKAKVTVNGVKKRNIKKVLSQSSIWISTSGDEVGAPIFYRDVPLPFIYAVNHKDEIKWRLGDITSDAPPPVVLENLPVCGNCHSFTADGSIMGMDVDYANDKGSYVITTVEEEIMLSKDRVITWSDYMRDEQDPTFGLLSQISPDGRFAVSTVKDRSVFVPKPDLYYSQLFFPLKGILGVYNRETGTFSSLPGANDREYVQSNPSWTPDGKYIVFARSRAAELKSLKDKKEVLLSPDECQEYIDREKLFLFDLYKIPFNNGKGGKPEPIEGASYNGMSNFFAKYSPDGRWMVFNRASSFMLLQPDSELFIMPADGGDPRRMTCNTDNMNSWHSWSPNSRWLVFASKVFTPYTQLFLTHIDEDGNDTPPVLLASFTAPDRAANIPEFVNIKPDGIARIYERYVDEYSFYREGGGFLNKGQFELAEEAFLEALKMNPENPDSHVKLATLYIKTGDYERAQEALETALKFNPDNVEAHINLAGILISKKEYDRAHKQLEAVLKRDPDNTDAHNNIGLLYMRTQDYENAEEEFRTALRLDPANSLAHRNLGTVFMRKQKYDDAEKAFKASLEFEPNNSLAHINLGRIYTSRENYTAAEKEFRKALELDPNNANIYFALGEILSEENRSLQEAKEFIQKGLSIHPSHFGGHIMLANLHLRTGEVESAVREFERALRLNPNAPGLKEKIDELKRIAR